MQNQRQQTPDSQTLIRFAAESGHFGSSQSRNGNTRNLARAGSIDINAPSLNS